MRDFCPSFGFIGRFATVVALAPLVLAINVVFSEQGFTRAAKPFAPLPGRWVGQGRLGFKSGDVENIKCRATYFVNKSGDELKQNIRCASASGKVELKSQIRTDETGNLSGSWQELMYNLAGDLEGNVTNRGFRIRVKAKDLNAHMEIIVKDDKQMVEMHFDSETLIGMTLVLKKG